MNNIEYLHRVLHIAAKQFRWYEKMHLAKGPDSWESACPEAMTRLALQSPSPARAEEG